MNKELFCQEMADNWLKAQNRDIGGTGLQIDSPSLARLWRAKLKMLLKTVNRHWIKEWILFYFCFSDRIYKIFRIFFPGFPDESLEATYFRPFHAVWDAERSS